MQFLSMQDVDLSGKRVLIREDFNVPIKNGKVQSDVRIKAALPGIRQALAAGAKVKLMSHLGRPSAPDPDFSLQPVAMYLQEALGMPITFMSDLKENLAPLVIYENVRFLAGETTNDSELAKSMANLCDVFVMDAFGSAHRAHASTTGVCEYAPVAVAGPLLLQEITALDKIMHNPDHPVVAIIGGAKVSSKIVVLESLLKVVDKIIIGGGMANTFLAAQGIDVKDSLYEPDLIPVAQRLLTNSDKLILPIDFIWDQEKIVDIGANSCKLFVDQIMAASTILWNGPMGIFEDPRFVNGTQQVANAVAASSAYTVAGGGDTLAAIDKWHLEDQISYVSTGGGAFLEYIEGQELPAIAALINKSKYDIKTN